MKYSLISAVAVLAAVGCGSNDDVTNPPAPPPPPPPPAFAYQAIDLGTPDGVNAAPAMIDANGSAMVFVQQDDGRHIYRWDNGTLTDMGLLPGSDQTTTSAGGRIAGALRTTGCLSVCDTKRAVFLWDLGTVTELDFGAPTSDVSIRGLTDNGAVLAQVDSRAVLWQNGTRSDIGPAGTDLLAAAVNGLGQVVGTVYTAGIGSAFAWENGAMRDLGMSAGGATSEANGINDAGDIVGSSTGMDGIPRAVIWPRGGLAQVIDITPDSAYALAVNNRGQVLVASTAGRRWLWDGTGSLPIGNMSLRVSARMLNERGEVAGSYRPDGNGEEHAFVWRDGQIHDLGTGPNGVSASVLCSNANGDLLGYYITAAGNVRAILWKRL